MDTKRKIEKCETSGLGWYACDLFYGFIATHLVNKFSRYATRAACALYAEIVEQESSLQDGVQCSSGGERVLCKIPKRKVESSRRLWLKSTLQLNFEDPECMVWIFRVCQPSSNQKYRFVVKYEVNVARLFLNSFENSCTLLI